MSLKRILLGILFLIFGLFGVYFGELDDSPGAGGIGMIIAILGIYFIAKGLINRKKIKSKK